MKKRSLKLISFIISVIMLSATMAISISAGYPKHTDYVSDQAVILENIKEDIVKASDKLYKKRNVRIAVCTVLDTDGDSIESFGTEIFKKWGIGDGVLILISKSDDNFYAVQSNSLSEYLSEKDLKNILNTSLEPSFAVGDYETGVKETVNALSNHLSSTLPKDFGKNEEKGIPGWLVTIFVIIAVIILILGSGFAVIIYLRKKNARRRREEMELRRRRLAEGRGFDVRLSQNNTQTHVQGNAQRPRPNTAQRPMHGTNQRPVSNAPQRPMQGANQRVPQGNPQQLRRPSPNAATIQIDTSDIRAAKQNNRR